MKGFEKAGKVLEFDRITEKLASLAATEGAAEALRALQPADDCASVNQLLEQTEDARAMIVSGFADNVSKELPLEYAVEMNNLIRLEMKGSIG